MDWESWEDSWDEDTQVKFQAVASYLRRKAPLAKKRRRGSTCHFLLLSLHLVFNLQQLTEADLKKKKVATREKLQNYNVSLIPRIIKPLLFPINQDSLTKAVVPHILLF